MAKKALVGLAMAAIQEATRASKVHIRTGQ
jgi:hypothetical protein